MQVRKQQLKPDMELQTASKLGKEYIKAIYRHLAYLTYAEYIIWNARLDEAQVESCFLGEISITSDEQVTPLFKGENEEELNSLLMKVKGDWKRWPKTQHSEI